MAAAHGSAAGSTPEAPSGSNAEGCSCNGDQTRTGKPAETLLDRKTMDDLSANPPPAMDAAYVTQHHIAARYLLGQLPPRFVSEFERFCHDNPKFIDSSGLPERVNAGVRLLDVAGLRQPWDPEPLKFWQRLPVMLGLAALLCAAAFAAQHFRSEAGAANNQIATLQKRLENAGSSAISGTQAVTIEPSRTGPQNQAQFDVDLTQGAKFIELHFSMAWHPAMRYRITLERVDHGREWISYNVAKDSNGELRLSLNSSMLGGGAHTVTIEAQGLAAADVTPVAWARFEVLRPRQ